MAALRLEALRYHGRQPLSLTIPAGACLAVMGPSGVGKTRLLRALADLDPHEGQAFADDVAASALPPSAWRRRVATLPADARWWAPTVGAHFADAKAVDFSLLGFSGEVRDKPVTHLSSGERQRLALLRLLALAPAVLLLDEPTANLDASNVARVEAVIADYRRTCAAAVMWVTHDREQAARVAAQVLVLASDGGHHIEPAAS